MLHFRELFDYMFVALFAFVEKVPLIMDQIKKNNDHASIRMRALFKLPFSPLQQGHYGIAVWHYLIIELLLICPLFY